MTNDISVNATNMSELTHDACMCCHSKDGEDTTNFVKVDGIVSTFRFHPQRLEEKRELVTAILNELPADFKEGASYLKVCITKDDEIWAEMQLICEELVAMAIGLGLMEFLYSRDQWGLLPGSVPMLRVK